MSKYTLQAEFDGRLKNNEGPATATGTLATLTTATGKDNYITAAKVSFDPSAGGGNATVELRLDSTVLETAELRSSSTADNSDSYEFKNMHHKADASQVFKLEVTTISGGTTEGFVQCIEVPNGENPTTYTGS